MRGVERLQTPKQALGLFSRGGSRSDGAVRSNDLWSGSGRRENLVPPFSGGARARLSSPSWRVSPRGVCSGCRLGFLAWVFASIESPIQASHDVVTT